MYWPKDDKIPSYGPYCGANHRLVRRLIGQNPTRTVFAMPGGFLVHEGQQGIVDLNKALLDENGVTILMLPSKSAGESADLLASRQSLRGFDNIDRRVERMRALRAHSMYMGTGDIQVFSTQTPELIAELITDKLRKLGLPR